MAHRYFLGEWKDGNERLVLQDIVELCRRAESQRKILRDYPLDKILRVLSLVRAKWSDPSYPRLATLRSKLPSETGFSGPMLELGIQELVWVLDPTLLQKKLDAEMRDIPESPDLNYNPDSATFLRREPIGTVLHVLSGNVFLVGAGSLVEGLLTRNVTLLKMSSGEKVFLPELIASIQECDVEGVVSKSIALIDYSSKDKEVIAELKKRVDGIVVWGGEEAVRAYRNDLPARTRLVVFGPKLSFAIVTRKGAETLGEEETVRRLAQEISIWDQNACTAPQVCYVEGDDLAMRLVDSLAIELRELATSLPPGDIDLQAAVEIQKIRSVAEIAEARGKGKLRTARFGVDWTVYFDKDKTLDPSPLHRTLKLVPYHSFSEVEGEMDRVRGYIQTIGVAAGKEEGQELAIALSRAGALRVLELGKMSGGEIEDPHDGSYDLPQFVNFVVTRVPIDAGKDPRDCLPEAARTALIDRRLRELIDRAKRSEFYSKRFEGIHVQATLDLEKIPVLTREEMEANMPPQGLGLSTGAFSGGYVSRSGGSTGAPKFSIYDGADWEAMISEAVRVLRAAGLEKGDRVANCMLAGDLYGSFVSFDHINYRVGAMTFAFAGHVTPEVFLDTWKKFGINCIQAIPTVLVPLLRACHRLDETFTMEKIIFAGTPLSGSDRDWLRNVLGVKRIASIIGANDGGQLAFQCEFMSDSRHHLIDDFNFVEILDEQGKRVPEGSAGKIVITSLLKFAFPLIRYEIGDAARIVPEKCPCGRLGRVIDYLGRADDTVCIANMNLRYRDFVSALQGFPYSALQLIAKNDEKGEYLIMRVESEISEAEIEKKVYGAMMEKVEKLQERVKDKSLQRIDVEWLPIGTIPRNPRSGKIKQLCDERI